MNKIYENNLNCKIISIYKTYTLGKFSQKKYQPSLKSYFHSIFINY